MSNPPAMIRAYKTTKPNHETDMLHKINGPKDKPRSFASGFALQADDVVADVLWGRGHIAPGYQQKTINLVLIRIYEKLKIPTIICTVAATLTSFITISIWADTIENPRPFNTPPAPIQFVANTTPPPKMTNSTGGTIIKPDTNMWLASGTLTDISGFTAPYSRMPWSLVLGKPILLRFKQCYFSGNQHT